MHLYKVFKNNEELYDAAFKNLNVLILDRINFQNICRGYFKNLNFLSKCATNIYIYMMWPTQLVIKMPYDIREQVKIILSDKDRCPYTLWL